MTSRHNIEEAVRILVREARPTKIILFGCEAREDSDLDLLVIEPSVPNRFAEIDRLRQAIRHLRLPVDIIVASEQDTEDWSGLPGTLYYWALKEGRVIYEAPGLQSGVAYA